MKVSVYIAASLDGFIARENGDIAWLDDPRYAAPGEDFGYAAFNADVDALVMGRATYEKVLTFGPWPFEGRRVIVLSQTLPVSPEQKCEVSRLQPDELVEKLRGEGCRKIYLDGGKTIQSFLRARLVSDLTVTRIPVLLGSGLPLFGATETDIPLKHLSTQTWPNGFVQSHYEVMRMPAA
jgi:dihydrofolate reductase